MRNWKKLIILDLDGTVLDSLSDIVNCGNKIRSDHHLPPLCREIIKSFIGNGIEDFVKKLFSDSGTIPSTALNEFKVYYNEHIADQTQPFPGIRSFLTEAQNNLICSVVLSNKNQSLCTHVLEKVGLSESFRFIYGGDSFREKKPSPLGVQEIMRLTGSDPEQTFMVGDSPNDIHAGKMAGIATAAALYGYSPSETLISLNPDYLLHSASDLYSLI